MVRNTKGGNKSKKMGRKFVNQPREKFIRYADDVDEIYASIKKIYGGGMAEVACMDGIDRLCIIRKKFKGRNKRDNSASIGTYVLVGLRSWEVVAIDKKKKCDLLEIYSTEDIMQIKKYMTDAEWSNIVSVEDFDKENDDDGIEFGDEKTERYEIMASDSSNTKITLTDDKKDDNKIKANISDNDDEEIDVDDI